MSYPQKLEFSLPTFDVGSIKRKNRTYASNGSNFGPSQDVKVSLPQISRTFASNVKLTGKVTFTHDGTISTDKSYFLGGAYALFRDYSLRANNSILLDEIANMNVIIHHSMNMSMTASDKVSQFQMLTSESTGFTNLGDEIYAAANTNNLVFDFAVPIAGMISDSKMIPLHGNTWDMNFITETLANCVDDTTANQTTGYTLTDVRIEYDTLQLSPQGWEQWFAQNTEDGIMTLHSSTWLYNTASLSASTLGSVQLPLGSRASSIRGLLVATVPANINCGKFASVLPSGEVSVLIGGTQYPQIPLDCVNDPSTVYAHLLDWHGGAFKTTGTCIDRKAFLKGSTANGRLAAYVDNTIANYASWGDEAGLVYIDLEKHDESDLISGVSNQGTSTTLQMNLSTALSAQVHTVYVFFYVNQSVIIDYNTGVIQRRL